MIEVEGVRYRYAGSELDALTDLSFVVPRGCCFGLLGPNGAGKSTLLALLTATLRPQQGLIRILGRSTMDSPVRVARLGSLVPQELAFYPTLTGRENLAFFAGIQALPGAARQQALARCAEICSLVEVLDRRVETYSGGLKRRLNLAIGLLGKPQILYLDEPTVGIDTFSRQCILDAIRGIKAAGATIVYTSHYLEEVEAICDELAVLDHGRLVARAQTASLLRGTAERCLKLTFATPPASRHIAAIAGLPAHWLDQRHLVLLLSDEQRLSAILAGLEAQGHTISQVTYGIGKLEDAYRSLLGRAE